MRQWRPLHKQRYCTGGRGGEGGTCLPLTHNASWHLHKRRYAYFWNLYDFGLIVHLFLQTLSIYLFKFVLSMNQLILENSVTRFAAKRTTTNSVRLLYCFIKFKLEIFCFLDNYTMPTIVSTVHEAEEYSSFHSILVPTNADSSLCKLSFFVFLLLLPS